MDDAVAVVSVVPAIPQLPGWVTVVMVVVLPVVFTSWPTVSEHRDTVSVTLYGAQSENEYI